MARTYSIAVYCLGGSVDAIGEQSEDLEVIVESMNELIQDDEIDIREYCIAYSDDYDLVEGEIGDPNIVRWEVV